MSEELEAYIKPELYLSHYLDTTGDILWTFSDIFWTFTNLIWTLSNTQWLIMDYLKH